MYTVAFSRALPRPMKQTLVYRLARLSACSPFGLSGPPKTRTSSVVPARTDQTPASLTVSVVGFVVCAWPRGEGQASVRAWDSRQSISPVTGRDERSFSGMWP
jgi:hypothetical protein